MNDVKKKALSEIIIFLILDVITLVLGNLLIAGLAEKEFEFFILIDLVIIVLQIVIVFVPLLIYKDKEINLGFSKSKPLVQIMYGILLFVGMLLIFKLFGNSSEGQPFKVNAILAYTIMNAFSAATTEELAYRGLLYTRFKTLSGNIVVAIVISSVLFGVSHFLVGDMAHMIMSAVTGVLLCWARAYLKNCTLVSTMIAHFLYDFLMCYLTI